MSDNNYGQQGWAPGAPTPYGQPGPYAGTPQPSGPAHGFGQPEAPRESMPEPQAPAQHGGAAQDGAHRTPGPAGRGVKAIWKFSLRELILIAIGVVLIVFSFLPLTHGMYYTPIWGQGLAAAVAALAITAATVLLFLRRFVSAVARFRIGSLSIDQFASVAFSAYAIVFLGATFGALGLASAYGGFVGIGVSWTVWVSILLSLGGVFFTVVAPFVPPFRADFDERDEVAAPRAARPAAALVVAPKPPKPQPAQQQWQQGYGPQGYGQHGAAPQYGQPPLGQPNPYAPPQNPYGAPAPQPQYGQPPYGQPAPAQNPYTQAQPAAPFAAPADASPEPAPTGEAPSVIDQVPESATGHDPAADDAATAEDGEHPGNGEARSALDHSAAAAGAGTGLEVDGADAAPVYRRTGSEELPAAAASVPEPQAETIDAVDEDTVVRAPSGDDTGDSADHAAGESAPEAETPTSGPEAAPVDEVPSGELPPEAIPAEAELAGAEPADAEPAAEAPQTAEQPAADAPADARAQDTAEAAAVAPFAPTADAGEADAPADPSALPVTNNQPFWALVPVERDVVDAAGAPLFRIGPTAWALVLEERGDVYVVRHDDGRTGYLLDTTGVTRG